MITFIKRFFLFILALPLCSCAPVRLPDQGKAVSPIEMNTYRIVLSDIAAWKSWNISTKLENETVVFEKIHTWPLTGEKLGVTRIQILKNQTFSEEAWRLSDQEVADGIIAIEERIMQEEGVNNGQYSLGNVAKDTVTIGEKKLYRMNYKAMQGDWMDSYLAQRPTMDAAFYVFIPPNYKETHTFYEFLINVAHKTGRPVKVDLDRIMPVISGFELKTN